VYDRAKDLDNLKAAMQQHKQQMLWVGEKQAGCFIKEGLD
jgi:hypothetical protein